MNITSDNEALDDKKIWDIILGMSALPAVFVSYKLGMFETLNTDQISINQLSNQLNIETRPTEALVYMCINLGLLKLNDDIISLTPLSKKYLLENSPTSFCPLFNIMINSTFVGSIEHLFQSVLTNKAQTSSGDIGIFENNKDSYEQAKAFTKAMHSISMSTAVHWVNAINLSNYNTFLDIGAGSGAHSLHAINKWPNLCAILFDLASVCEAAKEIISNSDLQNRISYFTGDLWDSTYPPADIHFYSQIFHDWPHEKCQYLAQKSFDSLPKNGKIIIHEMLMADDKSGPYFAAASNVSMLLWTEGKQYSASELSNILQKAGFHNICIHKTSGLWQLITGDR